jgi:hypothetical protein
LGDFILRDKVSFGIISEPLFYLLIYKTMKLTKKIQKAIDLASRLHLGQTRKGEQDLPYISHPFSVAWILAEYTDNEDIIVAGLLHDVLEDVKDYGYADLKNDFGEKMARIVRGVSEDKDPNVSSDEKATWEERKQKYLQNLKKESRSALLVSAADKIYNLRSMVAAYQLQGEALWERFNAPADKRLWFYEEMVNALKGRIDKRMLAELGYEIRRLKDMVELGTSKLLIGLVPEVDDNVAVYLINNSDKNYDEVALRSGGNLSTDKGLVQTSEYRCSKGKLEARSALQLDTTSVDEMETSIWYHIDLHAGAEVEKVWASLLTSLGFVLNFEDRKMMLPVLGFFGWGELVDGR